MLFSFGWLLAERRYVSWRGIRWVIEDDRSDPGSTSNRLSSFRTRRHCHDSRVGDDTAIATIRNRYTVEIQNSDSSSTFLSTILRFRGKLAVSVFQQT